MDQNNPPVPLVRYGQHNANIPGDPFGIKRVHSGNVEHRLDRQRFLDFPQFDLERDKTPHDVDKFEALASFLSSLKTSFVDDTLDFPSLSVQQDDELERTVDFLFDSMTVRIIQLKDVVYTDQTSYFRSRRALDTESKAQAKMDTLELPMGRHVENYMMAQLKSSTLADQDGRSGTTSSGQTQQPPFKSDTSAKDKARRYKKMRTAVTRRFWVELSKDQRQAMRDESKTPAPRVQSLITQIAAEDRSVSQDYYYSYHKDHAAAADPDIYPRISKDILIVVDRNGDLVLASVSQLFQLLFGPVVFEKVTDALRKWSAIPPLPQPETSRHMVDEVIRKSHPELNMELAITPRELEERAACVVHYGTWAMKGHSNPKDIYLTDETRLVRGVGGYKTRIDYSQKLFPRFSKGVLGIGSEVARFMMRTLAPKEYAECLEVYHALPSEDRMPISKPNWATLAVVGINTFTQRHRDKHDVKFGLAALVALGKYKGGDLCLPQLGFRVEYQPGNCVILRGAEMEHFVADWTGARYFLLFTNHQAVRNFAYRRMGRLPSFPTDEWYQPDHDSNTVLNAGEFTDEGEDEYDPCAETHLDPEEDEEGITERDIHKAAYGTSSSSSNSTPGLFPASAGGTSVAGSWDRGSDTKRRRVEESGRPR